MPEKPEVEATAYIIVKAKGSGLGEKELEDLKYEYSRSSRFRETLTLW